MNKVSFITFASITSVMIDFRKSRFSVICSVILNIFVFLLQYIFVSFNNQWSFSIIYKL